MGSEGSEEESDKSAVRYDRNGDNPRNTLKEYMKKNKKDDQFFITPHFQLFLNIFQLQHHSFF